MKSVSPELEERSIARVVLNRPVFFSSALVILIFTLIVNLYPQQATDWLTEQQAKLSNYLGWYYMLVVGAYLIFVVWLALSRYGKVKLGPDDCTPDFSYGAWAGMLFSSGIGISLLYFGASEALTHYLYPPEGSAGTPEAARRAVMYTFLHWGIHGWAIYALMAVALGYSAYRFNRPLALRTALYPILGERVNGPIGHIVDCFGIIVTVCGLVSNLGIGTLQISAGLQQLFGLQHSYSTLVAVMLIMSLVATLIALAGIEAGIRRLSNLNIILFAFLLLYVLIFGSTSQLLNALIQNIGDYSSSLVQKTFDLYAYQPSQGWLSKWTLFYWAWWIAWAPFVGLFIARISRGREIREVVIGVLFLPLGFTVVWLSVFGNSVLDRVTMAQGAELTQIALSQPEMTIYHLLSYYPMSTFIIGMTTFVGFVLFLTPADSGLVMLANLSVIESPGRQDAPGWLRVFWAAVIMAVTAGLMYGNNITALQTTIVLASLPFSMILILYIVCLIKQLRKERLV